MSTYNLLIEDAQGASIGEPATNTLNCSFGDDPHREQDFTLVGDAAKRPYEVTIQKKPGSPGDPTRVKLFVTQEAQLSPNSPAESLVYPAVVTGGIAATGIRNQNYGSLPPVDPEFSRGPRTDGARKPELTAPASVDSTIPGVEGFGTSVSAPIAAAGAVLLKQLNPTLTNAQVRAALSSQGQTPSGLLEDTGPPLENDATGWNPTWGWGRLAFKTPLPYAVAADSDGDDVPDNVDSCPGISNPGQIGQYQDSDQDGIADPCDAACSGSPPIVISSIDPTSAAVDATVLVNGSGFASGDQVLVSGIPAATAFFSSTALTFSVPQVSQATHPVHVMRATGCISQDQVSLTVTSGGGTCGLGWEAGLAVALLAALRNRRLRR